MAERVQKQKSTEKQEAAPQEEVKAGDSKEELKDELDSLLDEIDSVLETNAEEFVKNYILEGRRVDSARPLRRVLETVR